MKVARLSWCLLCSIAFLVAGPASAATIKVSVSSDASSCRQGHDDGVPAPAPDGSVCSSNGAGTFDDWGAASTATGGTSAPLVGTGSTSTQLTIDAAVASDDGGVDVGQGDDRWISRNTVYNITLTIDVDSPGDLWSVDLAQAALGLYALRGDGSLTAVGSQSSGVGRASAISVSVNGNPFNVAIAPGSYSNNPSNTNSASQQFGGNRADLGVLAGVGDAVFGVSVSFELQALSNDGCSGFLCSSASGGEEAAVLFGMGSVIDQAVDEYSTWGRSQGPDGYTSIWTLNVVAVPEPTTLAMLALGLAGLVARRKASA